VLIVDACEAFIQNCGGVRKLSEHTTRAYRLDLNRFAGFAGAGAEVTFCERATLQQYIEHLFTQHNLKETSAKRHVASLRSLFRWLEDEGHVPEDPFRGARIRIRLPKRLPRVLSRGEVLLEKRPASGIWGGLWSLPELDVEASPREFLSREWGLEVARVDRLEPFDHAFTHFTLEVEPWRVELAKASRLAEGKAATWLALTELAGAALPSPVRKLLRSISAAAGTCGGSRAAASRR